VADRILVEKVRKHIVARDSILSERATTTAVCAAIKAKIKIGMGMKTKTKIRTKKNTAKKRILPIGKRCGVLSILLMLDALGSLIGETAGVTKAVSYSKAARRSRSCSVIIARWEVADCILLRTNMEKDYISAHINVNRA